MLGAALTVVVALCAVYAVVIFGLIPANADSPPWALEHWAAQKSLHATVSREMPKGEPPLPATDANLLAGMKVYGDNCLVCHGDANGETSNTAQGLYIRAPRFGARPIRRDPEGEIYWKVAHGVRWTAMPSYGKTLTGDQMWQVTLFLKHMARLSPAVKQAWDGLGVSAAPASAVPMRSQSARLLRPSG
jgi:thiosulfate dehydrogenase